MKTSLNKSLLTVALSSLSFVALSAHAIRPTADTSFEELATPHPTSDAAFHFSNLDGNPVAAPATMPILPAVPEPQTYALLLAGLAAGGFIARRRTLD